MERRPESRAARPRSNARHRSPIAPALCRCALAAIFVAGCGGPGFDGRTYTGDKYAFQVPSAPSSWTPIQVGEGALAYRDDANHATVAVNGRCDKDGDDVPLKALTQHLFILFTDREIEAQETVPFNGREAMRSRVTAKLDGVPKRFEVWVLKKDRCVYDLIYIAEPTHFDRGVESFNQYVSGFTVLPRHDD